MPKAFPKSPDKSKPKVTQSRVTKMTKKITSKPAASSKSSNRASSHGVPAVQHTERWEKTRETVFETSETHTLKPPSKTTPKRPPILAGGHIYASNGKATSVSFSITEPYNLALGLSMICEPSMSNIRAGITYEESVPGSKSLPIYLGGWADTKEYKLGGELLECPSGSGVQTGEIKTRTYPTWLPELTISRIRFASSIEEPKVVVWLKKLEMSGKHNWCINITASDISPRGFQLNIHTWDGSRVFGTDVTWIAYSAKEKGEEILSGVVGGGMPGSARQEKSLGGVVSLPEGTKGKREVLLALSGFNVKFAGGRTLNIQARGSSLGGSDMEWEITKREPVGADEQETGFDIEAASGQYILIMK
ncbi:hypothetical protein V8E51_006345 [Hyaloscypha variabilis]